MRGMAIYLDDVTVELPGDSLGAVIMSANRRLSEDGRIIVEVELDGEGMGSDGLESRQHDAIAGREVRMRSAAPRDLALQVLDEVRTRLHESRAVQAECAELIQRDQTHDALGRFNDVVASWLSVQEAVVNVTRLLDIKVEELTFGGRSAAEATESLVQALQSLKQMIQSGDTVGMADALAYEWPEMTDQWDRMLAELIGRIDARGDA
jgi:hypothetical protein